MLCGRCLPPFQSAWLFIKEVLPLICPEDLPVRYTAPAAGKRYSLGSSAHLKDDKKQAHVHMSALWTAPALLYQVRYMVIGKQQ